MGKTRKNFGKERNSTPSGNNSPIEVAIGKQSIGTQDTIEQMMVQIIGQAIYGGDFGSSAKSVRNLKNVTSADKAIGSVVSKIQKSTEATAKIFKDVPEYILAIKKATVDLAEKFVDSEETGKEESNKESLDVVISGKDSEKIFEHLSNIDDENVKLVIDLLNNLSILGNGLENFNKSETSISNFISVLSNAENDKNISKLQESVNGIGTAAASITAIGRMTVEIQKGVEAAKILSKSVVEVQGSLANIDTSKTKESQIAISDVIKLVVACSMVLTIGAFIVMYKPEIIIGALKFTAVLALFIGAISLAVILPWKAQGETAMGDLVAVSKFVAISAMVLVLGGLIIQSNSRLIKASLVFTGLLALFISAVTLAVILPWRLSGKTAIQNIVEIGKFVTISAAVMLIGAYFTVKNPMLMIGALAFTVLLSTFVLALNLAMLPMAMTGKLASDNLDQFALVVVACGAIMLIGAYFTIKNPMLMIGALAFTILLATFVLALNAAMLPMTITGKLAEDNLEHFALAVAVCGLVMLVGAYFIISNSLMIIGALAFTILLATFVLALNAAMLPMTITGKLAEENLKHFALAVTVCGLVMLVGAYFLMKNPMMAVWSLAFTLLLGTFVLLLNAAMLPMAITGVLAQQNLKWFSLAVATSAAVMLIGGGLMMKFPMLAFYSLVFAAELGIFIGLVMWALTGKFPFAGVSGVSPASKGIISSIAGSLKNTGNIINDTIKAYTTAKLISKLVTRCATIMLIGGLLFLKWPMLSIWCALFVATLVPFIFAIQKVCLNLAKYKEAIEQGVKVMNKLTTAMLFAEVALGVLALIMSKADPMALLKGAGIIGIVLIGLGTMASILGMPPIATFASAGAQVLIMLAGAFLISAAGLFMVAVAMDRFSKVKPMNTKVLMTNVSTLVLMTMALIPIGNPISMAIISMAALSIAMLGKCISEIANAIADVASLKIPIYNGTKIVAYRQLQKSDFKLAGENVSQIVTTLGNAIINVYRKNPAMFKYAGLFTKDTIFGLVVKSCTELSRMISKIASAVKDFASMKIPIYKGKDIVGYERLTPKDYTLAANNVTNVIMTLCNALMNIYNSNPSLFKSDDLMSSITGSKPAKTPMGIVISLASKVGKVISSIAHGVQAMGKLLIPVNWDKEGKPIDFKQMTSKDIIQAGENTKSIVVSMLTALAELYNENPNLYTDTSWFKTSGSSSPIAKVVKMALKVGKIISSVAAGVQSIAKLTIPIDWDKDGKPIKFQNMSNEDIFAAADNVKNIVTSMLNSLTDLYNANPEVYNDTSIFRTGGGSSPMAKVVNMALKIGKIISSVAAGVQSMSKLFIPIEWNKEGKPIKFERMTDADIIQSGLNVQTIVTSMLTALEGVYKPEIYDGDAFMKTPMGKVVEVAVKVGKIISSVSKGVQSMSKLLIPTEWNKDGKPIKFERMSNEDIVKAGTNTQDIVTSIIKSLGDLYDKHESWFSGTGDFGLGDTPANKVIQVALKVSQIVSNVAEGVGKMAKLQIPTEWDKNGKPIKFRTLSKEDFKLAKENIASTVVTIANGIMEVYNKHQDWFNEGDSLFSSGENPFSKVLNFSMGIGELISNISESVVKMSSSQIPIEWDKNGKPIKFEKLNEDHFILAKDNIDKVITTIANGLMTMYNDHQNWFGGTGLFGLGDTPFAKVLEFSMGVSEIIANITEAVINMATNKIPIKWDESGTPIDFENIDDKHFKLAKDNIAQVVTTIAGGLLEFYDKHRNWFGSGSIKNAVWSYFTGTPFENVINFSVGVSEIVKNVAEGIIALSSASIADEWNPETGAPIHFRQLKEDDFKLAKDHISQVVTTVGEGLLEFYDSHRNWFGSGSIKNAVWSYFTGTPFENVISFSVGISEVIKNIADGIIALSSGSIPLYDQNGEITGYRGLNENDFKLAKDHIDKIITTVGTALMELAEDSSWKDMEKIEPLVSCITTAVSAIGNSAIKIGKIGQGIYNVYDKNGEKIIATYNFSDTDFENGAENIKKIIKIVGEGISDASKMLETNYGWATNKPFNETPQGRLVQQVSEAISVISEHAQMLGFIGANKFPIYNSKKEFTGKFFAFKGDVYGTAVNIINTILTSTAQSISEAVDKINTLGSFFSADVIIDMIKKTINMIGGITYFVGNLGNGKYYYIDSVTKKKESINVSKEIIENAVDIISTILVNLSESINTATSYAGSVFGSTGGNINQTSVGIILNSIQHVISKIGNVLLFLSNLSYGQLDLFSINVEGFTVKVKKKSYKFDGNGALNSAIQIGLILTSLSYSISESVKKFGKTNENDADRMLRVVAKSVQPLTRIAENRETIEKLKGFSPASIVVPVLDQMKQIMDKMSEFDVYKKSFKTSLVGKFSAFGFGKDFMNANQTGFVNLLMDIERMVRQSKRILSVDLNKAYSDVCKAMIGTSDVMNSIEISGAFEEQIDELDKFIVAINSVKIEGADALTNLLAELNKLGINMGNLDKLVAAITENLSKTLTGLQQAINDVNKTMILDAKRKDQHKKEIAKSVDKINSLMNNNINVLVKTENNSTTTGGDATPGGDSDKSKSSSRPKN